MEFCRFDEGDLRGRKLLWGLELAPCLSCGASFFSLAVRALVHARGASARHWGPAMPPKPLLQGIGTSRAYMHVHVLMIALALVVSACTLPADDAGEIPVDELTEGLADKPAEPAKERDPEIPCDLNVHYPHQSHDNPENANVHATTICRFAVARIEMSVVLMRDGIAVGAGSGHNDGKRKLDVHAADTCIDAWYRGSATATVYFPPGHPYPRRDYVATGSRTWVTCIFPATEPGSGAQP